VLAVPLALFEERTAPNREKSGSLLFANALPLRTEREASLLLSPRQRSRYCLSYTETFVNFLPSGSVPLVVTVRVLPSADTTI